MSIETISAIGVYDVPVKNIQWTTAEESPMDDIKIEPVSLDSLTVLSSVTAYKDGTLVEDNFEPAIDKSPVEVEEQVTIDENIIMHDRTGAFTWKNGDYTIDPDGTFVYKRHYINQQELTPSEVLF